jgi:hypothetical protein
MDRWRSITIAINRYSVFSFQEAVMKKLAFLLLALPLAACATSIPATKVAQQAAGSGNCDPRFPGYEACSGYRAGATGTTEHRPFVSHWQVVTGNGAFLATPGEASAASTPGSPYQGP